jgi:uncharacterized membrane protein YeaQ/YmgE (transglycosylase-associated protein family)
MASKGVQAVRIGFSGGRVNLHPSIGRPGNAGPYQVRPRTMLGCLRGAKLRAGAASFVHEPTTNLQHILAGGRIMGIMHIIGTIIVGFIVGLLARFFYPGAVPLGFWLTVALGVGGSIVGGVIGSLLFKTPDGKFHPAGWFLSIIGALIILWGYINFAK